MSGRTPTAGPGPEAGEPASPQAGAPAREVRISAADHGIRLDRWFRRHMPQASFADIARWARTGQIRLDGRRARPGDRLCEGQRLRIPPIAPSPQAEAAGSARAAPLSPEEEAFARGLVIHCDPSVLVLAKPPGLAVQGGTATRQHVDRLLEALRFGAPERPRLVHRLDRDTSGVLVVARTARAAAFLSRCFAARETRKIYWAILVGAVAGATRRIALSIGRQPGTGGEKMQVTEKGQAALSLLRVLDRAAGAATLVEMQPVTGRTHQLRVHAAAIGHPILGDGKYGGRDAFLAGAVPRRLHLHARRISIAHPDGGRLDAEAPLPDHFLESLARLGLSIPGA